VIEQQLYQDGIEKANQKDFEGAIALFNEAIALNSDWADPYYQRGLAYFDSGKIHPAISDYSQALERDRYHSQAYYARALARISLKNLPGTLEDINWVIQLKPDFAAAYQLRGTVERKRGNLQSAIANFKQAAHLYLDQKDKENASRCLALMQQLQPKDNSPKPTAPSLPLVTQSNFYQNLIDKAQQGKPQEAKEELNWILKTDPNNGTAYYSRGLVHVCLEEMGEAIADYQRAASKFCEQEKWSDYNQAIAQLKKLQKAVPQTNTIQLESLLRQRLLRLVGGHWEIAQRLIDKAKQNYPGMAQEWYLEKVITDLEQK